MFKSCKAAFALEKLFPFQSAASSEAAAMHFWHCTDQSQPQGSGSYVHNNAHNLRRTLPDIAGWQNSNPDLRTFDELCVLLVHGRSAVVFVIQKVTQHAMEQLVALMCCKLFILQP